jgi:hypothetical protein
MKPPIVEAKLHHSGFWQVVRNRWGTILFTVLLCCLLAMGVSQRDEMKMVGRVRFQFFHTSKGDRDHWLGTELKLITANETMLRVVRKLDLARIWKLNRDEGAAMIRLRAMIETPVRGEQDVITIEVYSPEADEAVRLANAVADAYEGRHRENEEERWQERRQEAMNTLAKGMASVNRWSPSGAKCCG